MYRKCFETKYPITGSLSGEVHGSGTRADPVIDADLVLAEIQVKGLHFDRLSGQLHWAGDSVQLTGAELRQGAGRITGDLTLPSPRGNRGIQFSRSGDRTGRH